ncbi:MAG: L,D-transpeptidase family protein [Vicinamibacterales bacterium]
MLRARLVVAAVAMIATASLPLPNTQVSADPQDVASAIRQAVEGRTELIELYAPAGFTPIWTDSGGALSRSAQDALRLLEWAPADGLDPADYAAADLRATADARHESAGGQLASIDTVADFDVALSASLLRYFRDLHMGRVNPRDVGFTLDMPLEEHDFATLVRDGAAQRELVQTAHALTPRGQQYPALASALARYRELALGNAEIVLPRFEKSVHPGEQYSSLPELRAALILLGDLDAASPALESDRYDGVLVEAVRHFQRRHSLEPDGVLGKTTIAELTVPLAWRVRQIELAMEEQRWLRDLPSDRLIVVNIPMFRVTAWDTTPAGGAPAFTSRVIVGKAAATPTPVVSGMLSEVIFRPYWNVPTSIVRKEILPALARQPDYLERERMELVAGQADESPVVSATAENLALLRSGRVRLRQRPGPQNALGLIKFSFRNEYDVYMHSTPAPGLFARSRRDFSHGCVRVGDPIGLAEWVLGTQLEWSRERITAAMNAPQSARVAVRAQPRVMLLYTTAEVQLDSGDVAFAHDIYGHDGRLDRAIRLHAAATK